MNKDQLKSIQTPLKERYKNEPASAFICLTATGSLDEGIACTVQTGQALAKAGLHPATGGNGHEICSGDMLLQALVACAGVTLRAVATSMDIEIENGKVEAEGDLDFRGTLGVSKEAPVGFISIRLKFDLKTTATAEQLDILLKLTERYCVVYQTIVNGTRAVASWTKVA